jgi:hypothetical protein
VGQSIAGLNITLHSTRVVKERTDTCAIPSQLFSPLPMDRLVYVFPRQKMRHPITEESRDRQAARHGKHLISLAGGQPVRELSILSMPIICLPSPLPGNTAMANTILPTAEGANAQSLHKLKTISPNAICTKTPLRRNPPSSECTKPAPFILFTKTNKSRQAGKQADHSGASPRDTFSVAPYVSPTNHLHHLTQINPHHPIPQQNHEPPLPHHKTKPP